MHGSLPPPDQLSLWSSNLVWGFFLILLFKPSVTLMP